MTIFNIIKTNQVCKVLKSPGKSFNKMTDRGQTEDNQTVVGCVGGGMEISKYTNTLL